MGNNSFITLVVHSQSRALRLKEVLEAHGIVVSLEKINTDIEKDVFSAIKVKVDVVSLPLAVKILESGDLVSAPLSTPSLSNFSKTLLIPIDFSKSSILAIKVGFYLAKRLQLEPLVLHSFLAPQITPGDFYNNQIDPVEVPEISEIEEEIDIKNIASSQLSKFKRKIDKLIKDGEIEDVKFSTVLIEGVAEQVIHEYCRQNHPFMIVMTTRDVSTKETDLVGSVTAEVIDSCRIPILTVPDNYIPHGVENIKRIVMFCTLTDFDIVIVRGLMRMFNYPACEIWLIPSYESHTADSDNKLDKLVRYLGDTFPTATFHPCKLGNGKFDDNIRNIIDRNKINMIFVPNKKSNAISRFFRPTLAHRILFERDIPLLVIPV